MGTQHSKVKRMLNKLFSLYGGEDIIALSLVKEYLEVHYPETYVEKVYNRLSGYKKSTIGDVEHVIADTVKELGIKETKRSVDEVLEDWTKKE